jgi:hypothetical protein
MNMILMCNPKELKNSAPLRNVVETIQKVRPDAQLMPVQELKSCKGENVVNVGAHFFIRELHDQIAEAVADASLFCHCSLDPASQLPKQVVDAREGKENIVISHFGNFIGWRGHTNRWSIFGEERRVNWNQGSYRPVAEGGECPPEKTRDFIYWGAFRKDRVPKFEHYLNTKAYRPYIGCSPKAMSKFAMEI